MTLPPGWTLRPFGDCAARVVRRVDPGEHPDDPYVGLEHIGVGTLYAVGQGRAADVTGDLLRAHPGDVIFGRLRPYFRKVVRVAAPVLCTPEAWVLRARAGVEPRFLFYVAASPAFVDACAAAAGGTRMPRAEWPFAAQFPVALPPLDEQRRIGAALGVLDDKIQLLRDMAGTLGELLGALHHKRCVGPAAGGLPAGWRWGGLGDIARSVRDHVAPDALDPATPYVGLEHVPRRALGLPGWGKAGDVGSAKVRFEPGDTLFGRLRPYFHKVVPAPVAGVASPDILVVRALAPRWRSLTLAQLFSDDMVAHATATSDGTKMPRTRWEDLCRRPLALPPDPVVERFAAEADPLVARIHASMAEARDLARLRDTLLPALLAGERRAPSVGEQPRVSRWERRDRGPRGRRR